MRGTRFNCSVSRLVIFMMVLQFFVPVTQPVVAVEGSSKQNYEEDYRPQYHYSPKENWMNDPNGLVYYDGEYHLFYQHNPTDTKWGSMYWGHATSKDLVNWEEQPIALYPDEKGFIWSGSVVVDHNNTSGFGSVNNPPMVAMFTHEKGGQQIQSLAYSTDKGRSWTKYEGNPVIDMPEGVDVFRDPKVFWHEGSNQWVMVISVGDRIYIYNSPDLKNWTKSSEFGADAGSHNGIWEVPDLFKLPVDGDPNNTKWVMQVSMSEGAPAGGSGIQYFIGEFDGSTFTNDNPEDTVLWTDYGADFYAGISFNNIPKEDGRRLWLGWMSNWQYGQDTPTNQFRSSMSLVRELQLTDVEGKGIRVVQTPAKELQKLRNSTEAFSVENAIISSDSTVYQTEEQTVTENVYETNVTIPENVYSDKLEIVAKYQVDGTTADEFGVKVREGTEQFTKIGYDSIKQQMFVDRSNAGESNFSDQFAAKHDAPLSVTNNTVTLHAYVDRASVELFGNEGEAVITDQIFPDPASIGMELYAVNGEVTLKSLDIYSLNQASISKKESVSKYNIENPGFETGDLTGWTVVSGEPIGDVTSEVNYWHDQPVNKDENYHLWGNDSRIGVLKSSTFTLGGTGEINFLIGGGNYPENQYVALVRASDGQELMKTTNQWFDDTENYHRVTWDASEYYGEKLYIKVVDKTDNGWGHINVDDFHVFNHPKEIKNPDFETGDLTGWTEVGSAFNAPVSNVTTFWGTQPFNQQGTFHAWGFAGAKEDNSSDFRAGVMKSSLFTLSGNGKIDFLIGGGKDIDKQYVALVRASDGQELFKATGSNNEGYRRVEWNAASYLGENLFIKVVDYNSGDFGHLNVDDFNIYNTEEITSDHLVNPSFETGDLTGWKAEGDAFNGVVTDAGYYWDDPNQTFGHQGTYHAWGFSGALEEEADGRTGKLTSNPFILSGNGKINFMIGGGDEYDGQTKYDLYVALVRASDGKELFKATGPESEEYTQISWDAAQYLGEEVYIKVVDTHTGGFGHINIDDFHVKNQGIFSHWSFDEGQGTEAQDKTSGKSDYIEYVFNDAKYKPSTDPLWRDGVINKALLFDGYSTWIKRPNREVLQPKEQLTIEAWLAPRAYEFGDGGQLSAIVNQHDPDKNEGYILGMGRHGKWSLQAGINGDWMEVWADETKPIPKHQWSHVTATLNTETQKMKLYLNGELVGEVGIPESTRVTPTENDFLIGKHNNAVVVGGAFNANMFNGIMDEVKVYNKALTQNEVQSRYDKVVTSFNGELPEPNLQMKRSRYDGDRYRPQYHFISPGHWMNEPHAPMQYNGKYHIFYQHNPQGPYWHHIHWGHAISDDMVHWEDASVALAPEGGSESPDGVWSGDSTFDENGEPVLFFTAGDDSKTPNQMTGLAKSVNADDPRLEQWEMHGTPVTIQESDLPAEEGEVWYGQFRDPFVWKDGDTWYQLVGSGIKGVGGTALLYTSQDLVNWTYQKPFFVGNEGDYPKTGDVWELPVFLPLGKDSEGNQKYAFFINPWFDGYSKHNIKYVPYWVGEFDKGQLEFIPDHEEPRYFDYGNHFTGPSGMVDEQGRSILFSIAQDRRNAQQHYDAGWAHNAGLPLQLSLRGESKLGVEPIPELESLRGDQLVSFKNKGLTEANQLLENVQGDMLEIKLELEATSDSSYGIKLRRTPDGEEETFISYDKSTESYKIDVSKSSADPDITKISNSGKLTLEDGENLKLHIYVDRSMIEAYANGKKSITTRAYPTRPDALGIKLWSENNNVNVNSMEVWEMNSAYGETVPAYYPDETNQDSEEDMTGLGQLQNHDFQTGDLTGWKVVEGDTFNNDHVTNAIDWGWGGTFRQATTAIDSKRYHLWGFNSDHNGDDATGILKSRNFKLGGSGQIDFLTSGGANKDQLYVALVRASDEKILMKATGHNGETYRRVEWDANDYLGEELYIMVVDYATGGWGHINLDDVNVPVSDVTEPETIVVKPEPVYDDNEWYTSEEVNLTFKRKDNLSGIEHTWYRVNSDRQEDWKLYSPDEEISVSTEGENIIEYYSVDNAGNKEKTKTTAILIDKTDPTLDILLDKSELKVPNHKLYPIHVEIDSSDKISGMDTIELTSITSNEVDNGNGDGHTSNDIQGAEFGTNDDHFELRAERSSLASDRVYTITYTATDKAGNKTIAKSTVTVSHDQRKEE